MAFNPVLFALAQQRLEQDQTAVKTAAGEIPGMSPGPGSAPQQQQQIMPAGAGGGGMGQVGGQLQMPQMPMQMPGAGGGGAGGKKFDPQMVDVRLYNMQQQLTAIMNHLGIQLPPGAVVTPPGQPVPPAEMALPGAPMDPSMMQQAAPAGAGAPGQGAPMDPAMMQQGGQPPGAMDPAMLAAGGAKTAEEIIKQATDSYTQKLLPAPTPLMSALPMGDKVDAVKYLLGLSS